MKVDEFTFAVKKRLVNGIKVPTKKVNYGGKIRENLHSTVNKMFN